MLQDQAYFVPRLPKYLSIISTQGVLALERYKGNFIAHCHDEHDSYVEHNLNEDNPGWQKSEPVKRVYVKYDPKKNL